LVDGQLGSWSGRVVPEVADAGFVAADEGDGGVSFGKPAEDSNGDLGVIGM